MAWFWIFDRDETPQGHPLRVLLDGVQKVYKDETTCRVRRSRGYGITVNEWGRTLDEHDELSIPIDELARLSDGTVEWFYDLDATCGEHSDLVRFGLHDSTCLFLECELRKAQTILAPFKDVREGQRPPW